MIGDTAGGEAPGKTGAGLQQEGREDEARQRALSREQEWIGASPKARLLLPTRGGSLN